MVFTNYASFQLVNQGCGWLDQFQEGEIMTVTFNIRGTKWERDGQVKYITNLNAWRIEQVNNPYQNVSSNNPTPQNQSSGFQAENNPDPDELPF